MFHGFRQGVGGTWWFNRSVGIAQFLPPPARSNKNRKKCDETAKKHDEMVTGAVFSGGTSGAAAVGKRLLSRRHQGAEEEFG
jgi:hypothetical protein